MQHALDDNQARSLVLRAPIARMPERWTNPLRAGTRPSLGWAFVLPSLAVFAAVAVYPLASAIWLAFQRRHLFSRTSEFVGLANFASLLSSPEFWNALWNGVVFSLSTVLLQLLAGVGTALLLHHGFKGRALARGLILFPFIVPTVVAVLVWKWMLNDLYGVVNLLLIQTGLVDEAVLWLASPSLAMTTVVVINVWMFFPFITIHVLARLQLIPLSLYEAAVVDGASAFQRFVYITLPHLYSTIALVVLVRLIWMFNKFDAVWLITEGGPLGATQTLPLLAYLKAFGQYELGAGSAVATCIFVILALSATLYLRLLRNEAPS
jgi:multiple sugar transport system permease protein